MPFYLLKNEPIAPGLRRIASEQISITLSDLADEAVPRYRKVHSMRTRCKKLRGLLRLPQPLMGDAFRREDQRFRTAARQLAGNRDMEVCARTIASLNGSTGQTKVLQQPVSVEEMESSRQILSICLDEVQAWPLDLCGFHDIAPGFARTYRKSLDAWESVLREQSDENFHRLRRWAKYHWYQVRILERLNKKKLRKRRKRLRRLQLTLGDAHDLVLLQAFLRPDVEPDMQLLQLACVRKDELYADAMKTGQKIFAVPVSILVADCSRYWADQRHFRV